jgi:hypothetical protein
MPERGRIPTEQDRLLVELNPTGQVWVLVSGDWAYVRLHSPPPVDPWERQQVWAHLAGHADRDGVDVAMSIEYQDTDAGPRDVEVYAVAGHIAARRTLVPADDRDPWSIDEISIHRLDGRVAGVTSWRDARLGDVGQALDRALGDPVVALRLGDRWGARVKPKPGRQGRPDLFYAVAALDYVRALEVAPSTPVHWLAEKGPGAVTADQLRARIRRARERGLLTKTPKRHPGGELTEKAKGLLSSAGLLDEGDE